MSDNQELSNSVRQWPIDPGLIQNIVYSTRIEQQLPAFLPFPDGLDSALQNALRSSGIIALYTHQLQAWQNAADGLNQVIVAGTAGGKSLGYNLPVINHLLAHPEATALYVFPTKALTQDQLTHLDQLLRVVNPDFSDMFQIHPAVYDGDTQPGHRRAIREKSRIILTNPDMLHAGILPRHPQWAYFFSHLKFIVLDEIHIYRGVFGSHVANVIRRLNRICSYYGSQPVFFLTSATIGNPQEHASALISQPVELVNQDGSGHGQRTFCIYNPPLSNPDLGIRKSALFEAIHLLNPLLMNDIQTIVFGRSRKTVEMVLNYFNQLHPEYKNQVRAYRGGYLPKDRREIEKKLRERDLKAVISTNALELGVDIGSMDASLLIGYPGTLASTMQQIGRAGRQSREALSMLIATADPIDQYLAHHPDYFLGLTPERALIDPNHLIILLNHLQCAAYELPFTLPPAYGDLSPDLIQQFLQLLEAQGWVQWQGEKLFWMTTDYPSSKFSLRNASADQVLLRARQGDITGTIGTVDKLSSYWLVHPEAIYLQDGKTYFVENLNLDTNTAEMVEVEEDYFTEAQKSVEIQILKVHQEKDQPAYSSGFGDINVQTQIKSYKKIKYFTHEQLGMGLLDLPVVSFPTTACWFAIKEPTISTLRDQGLWLNDQNNYGPDWPAIREAVRQRDQYRCRNCGLPENGKSHHVHHLVPFKAFSSVTEANQINNLVTLCPACHRIAEVNLHMQSGLAGIAFAFRHLTPFFLMCDMEDIDVLSEPQSAYHDGLPTITIYDEVPGGIGLSRAVFDSLDRHLQAVSELIHDCPCPSGCPSCIGPGGENGYGGKQEALAILERLVSG
jgi:DEAD/DEAH box helicase domain-containing protein